MVFLDDIVMALGAGISSTSLIILFVLLSRYQRAVEDARKSSELAKNLFDALNARLTVQDTRIVDLMAKLEVYSAGKTLVGGFTAARKPVSSIVASQASVNPVRASQHLSGTTSHSLPVSEPLRSSGQSVKSTNITELTILGILVEGPKVSNRIRDVIQVTREHNARLLKGLYERGLVSRTDAHKPYLYEITEVGRAYLESAHTDA